MEILDKMLVSPLISRRPVSCSLTVMSKTKAQLGGGVNGRLIK